MTRPSNVERILRLLAEAEGLSNLRIKTELNLGDDTYVKVRNEMLNEGLIEKYACRGGGIRLTRAGEREVKGEEQIASSVDNEAALYRPLIAFLEEQAAEDEMEAVVCSTHQLKARGQWQNPDLSRITIDYFRNLHKVRVSVTTYEVKQFPRWNVSAVYEAASHHRFSHEAYVVLEWPKEVDFSLTDPTYKLDQIARECQRHGVGLATLHQHYTSYRLRPRIEPAPRKPNDEDVDNWLDYVLSRNANARSLFDKKMSSVLKELRSMDES